MQSAYRPKHSTETALLKVKSDIVCEIDNRRAIFLVLLDLSAAFDTIDHDILTNRLSNDFGFRGNVVSWFRSYLYRRTCKVKIANEFSDSHVLNFGLPQGSCVGPQMFSFYTHPIADIIKRYKHIKFHFYADDTQLYISFDPNKSGDADHALVMLSACIEDIKSWMSQNMLCLNSDKTEFFIAANPRALKSLCNISLRVGDIEIRPSPHVRNLGVEFDCHLNMSHHVTNICRSLNFHLRNLSRIRMFIDETTCHHAIRALVTSRLDYSNSLLQGSSAKDIKRLQRLQNRAAKLIYNAKRRDHATPLLHKLHWLPVKTRIEFKILTIVYKCFNDGAPCYLKDLTSTYVPKRSGLRSASDTRILTVPKTRLTISKKGFYASGPFLWNNLPRHIRHASSLTQFKKMLKTHLFHRHHGHSASDV